MASELRVNTLKDASGNNSVATSFVARGSAKSWAAVTAAGALSDSLNVSSHDDDGTGDGGVNFTSNMDGAATYSISMGVDDAGSSSPIYVVNLTQGTQASGAFDYESAYAHSNNDRTNNDAVRFVSVHGDLA